MHVYMCTYMYFTIASHWSDTSLCLPLYLHKPTYQIYAADDLSRQHFQW